MRTSNTQLPTAHELTEILSGESPRKAVKFDFIDNNYDVFSAYRNLAKLAGANTAWMYNYKELALEQVVTCAHETSDALTDYLLAQSVDSRLINSLFDHLAIDQPPEPVDAIFVFGSPANMRITKAIELFKLGIASKLIVSGRGPHYKTHEETEAERMADIAVGAGIPKESILVENGSITLPDSVKRTLDLFDKTNYQPRSICIVATTYIMRRAYMEWYKFTPRNIKIIPISATATAPELRRDSWFKSEKGIRMLLNEYAKMVIEHRMDLLRAAG